MKNQPVPLKPRLFLALCLAVLTLGSAAKAVELSDFPLFVSSTADPNIVFVLDDSKSMRWGFIPDTLEQNFNFPVMETIAGEEVGVCQESIITYAGSLLCPFNTQGRKFLTSHEQNPMYFNPGRNYPVPFRADGQPLSEPINANAAPVDGYKAADPNQTSPTIDLATDYRAIMDDFFHSCEPKEDRSGCTGSTTQDKKLRGFTVSDTLTTGEEAFYYQFDSTCTASNPLDDTCYTKVTWSEMSAETRQNFANWFSYYRTRLLAAKTGITAAFLDQPSNLRIGYETINNTNTSLVRGVLPFSGSDRTAFFNWLHGLDVDTLSGTPLRRSLKKVGDYYAATPTDTGPWASDPGVADAEPVSDFAECRQSFSIMMTDGQWDDASQGVGDVDGVTGSTITGPGDQSFTYQPVSPFADADHGDTLADLAMHYWNRDLQPDIVNRIPDTERNPSFWQHMIFYGLGLGAEGNVDPQTAFDSIDTGATIDWANPASGSAAKVDDLLHAALNARGGFFNIQEAREFATDLTGVLGQISEEVGSSTGVTFDTATLEEDSLIFAARFDSARWKGDLDARPLITNDDDPNALPEIGQPAWSAADKLDARNLDASDPAVNPRKIITSAGGKGIPFTWDPTVLSDTQKADLRFGASAGEEDQLASNRVDYLRGDRSQEGVTDGFRLRDSRLGDIVNSTPVRVSSPGSGWPDADPFGQACTDAVLREGCKRYSDFRATNIDRQPVIYAGANDGMLHGFTADEQGGDEVLAFVPSSIFSANSGEGLHHLTNTGYSHKFYVDLPPLVADAFIRGRDPSTTDGLTAETNWRTVLLGGPRFGARSIFALDVTDPTRFSEANAAELMLWEFGNDDANGDGVADGNGGGDPRLGFITQPPIIAMADWGSGDLRWTAFVANGYNSTQAATGFFMLDMEGGMDGTWTLDTDYRFVSFDSAGTGLSPLAVYDLDGDRIVDRIYAGDLEGRMWVAESTNKGFVSVFSTTNGPEPLFIAEKDTVRQPITASPLIIPNVNQQPQGSAPDLYVLFGTGQFLNETDLGNTSPQSFYAVRDQSVSLLGRGDLAQRNLREVKDFNATGNDVLFSEESENLNDANGWYVDLFEAGERITLPAQVRGNFIFANSAIPSENPCVAGGASRAMAFGLDGLTPTSPVFTAMDDPVVAYKLNDGIPSQSAFLGDFRFTPTSVGNVVVEGINTGRSASAIGRQGWQEMIE